MDFSEYVQLDYRVEVHEILSAKTGDFGPRINAAIDGVVVRKIFPFFHNSVL